MKKWWLIVSAVLLVLLAGIIITIYSWSQTPFGTLHYLAAIGVRLIYEPPDIENYSPIELREQYRQKESTSTKYLQYVSSTKDTVVLSAEGEIPIRLYYPSSTDNLPIIVYYHGGGFVFGTLNEYDLLCAKLAQKASALVVSVDYRLAPEYPYPAAAQDAYTALQWVYQNAQTIGGDSTRIAVAGDSAGGNLATVASLMARDSSQHFIDYQVLLYPATQSLDLTTVSHQNFGEGYGITTRQIDWYIEQYLPNEADRYEAYASPLLAEDLSNLPPALVVLAGFDPLKTEGQQYAEKLQTAGVPVKLQTYESMIHGFANIHEFPQSDELLDEIAVALASVF
ncbi:alpha/beta hydrolase [Tunicatimonas pelagia]|uniref:alpha/beta hydrolase n=1 Tax=Tunicatimonas pelagia TaxID=931531 RepID=UPI002666D834|nr:alpha/beta hydrolase [Tunicatimonas pelagia]WKN45581.1 alpha/beta hydrolase [Tunicatimonas pelagia]